MRNKQTRLSRLLIALVVVAMMLGALVPAASASETDIDQQQLDALRTELVQIRSSLDSDAVRWLALFDAGLLPLADAVEELEDDVDSLLITIDGPMTSHDYELALQQLNDGIDSWQVVVDELAPYELQALRHWQAVLDQVEAEWVEVAAEVEAEWVEVAAEVKAEWVEVAAEVEAEWVEAVAEWESEWAHASQDAATQWSEVVNEWEQAWVEAVVEWEQAWDDVAAEWEQAWDDVAAEWD